MKLSPHQHNLLTLEEVQRLEQHYRRHGVECHRSINADPRYFDLTVLLPEQKYLKPTPRSMQNNKLWG